MARGGKGTLCLPPLASFFGPLARWWQGDALFASLAREGGKGTLCLPPLPLSLPGFWFTFPAAEGRRGTES